MRIRTILSATGLAIATAGIAQEMPPPVIDPASGDAASQPNSTEPARATLSRVVRRFDFEEIVEQPHLLPIGFSEIAHRPGFPGFHKMMFSNETAHGGAWSFLFEVNGGSAAALADPFEIPIIPGGDYLLTGWVRTEGLDRARARVIAGFFDQAGGLIPESRVESDLMITRGDWRRFAVTMHGEYSSAAHIGFELQFLQPDQYERARPEDRARPLIEDVQARVWWDDIEIRQLPRIELATSSPQNIVIAPATPELVLRVRDLAGESMQMRVKVTGIDGRPVLNETVSVRGGRFDRKFNLRDLPFGWFEAEIAMRAGGDTLESRRLTFLHLASCERRQSHDRWLGVSLDDSPLDRLQQSADLIERLALGPVVVPVWRRSTSPSEAETQIEQALARIIEAAGDVVMALPFLPHTLARELHLDENDVGGAFVLDSALIEAYLAPLLVRFGQRVRIWQIGAASSASSASRSDPLRISNAARKHLSPLVPGPEVLVPIAIDSSAAAPAGPVAGEIVIASTFAPQSIDEIVAPLIGSQSAPVIVLEALPRERFSARERVIDMAHRVLESRRAGAARLLLPRPWRFDDPSVTGADLDPVLAAWMELRRAIGDASYVDEFSVGPGLRCYAFERSSQIILVAWNETAEFADAFLRVHLAEGAVTARDMLGNETSWPGREGMHEIPLTDMPIFVLNADPRLIRFRQGFEISPAFISSAAREHALEITLSNPWETTISGTLMLTEPADWNLTPRRHRFSIEPGASITLPVTLFLGRTELAGHRRIEALVEFDADRPHAFRVWRDVEIGVQSLDLQTAWRIARALDGGHRDLIVEAHITNRGERPASLEAFTLAPGYQRMRHMVATLGPGETTVKTFHFRDGLRALAGSRIIVGVSEMESPARLNKAIDIPPGK